MDLMTDVMLDIETTGTDAGNNAIIQIGAVKFNFDTEAIGGVFDRCLAIAPRRYWDEGTRTWWRGQNQGVFNDIIARMEEPEPVLRDLIAWANEGAAPLGLRMWAKPISFDFGFVQSYMNQYGLPMPFHYRHARDLNTFIAAQAGGADHYEMEHIEYPTGAHNAVVDCVDQLKRLFAAKRRDFGAAQRVIEG
jgi:hypothetical protein